MKIMVLIQRIIKINKKKQNKPLIARLLSKMKCNYLILLKKTHPHIKINLKRNKY